MKNKNYHLILVHDAKKKPFYVRCACSFLYKYLYKMEDKLKKNVFWRGITLLYLFGCRKKWRLAYRDVGKLCLTCSEISRDFANFEMKYSDLWISIDYVNCGHFKHLYIIYTCSLTVILEYQRACEEEIMQLVLY